MQESYLFKDVCGWYFINCACQTLVVSLIRCIFSGCRCCDSLEGTCAHRCKCGIPFVGIGVSYCVGYSIEGRASNASQAYDYPLV